MKRTPPCRDISSTPQNQLYDSDKLDTLESKRINNISNEENIGTRVNNGDQISSPFIANAMPRTCPDI